MNNRESLIKLLDRLSDKALERVYRLVEYIYIYQDEARCGMSEKRREEKNRLIDATNEILCTTDSLWVLEQIYRCARNMTREDGE